MSLVLSNYFNNLFTFYENKVKDAYQFRSAPTLRKRLFLNVYICYALLESIRLLAVCISLKFGFTQYFQYDLFMHEFVLVTNFDYLAFFICSIWCSNAFVFHYIVYNSSKDNKIWQMIHTLVITNSQHFFKLNPMLKNKKLLKVKNAKFNCKILQSFSGITIQLRIVLVHMVMTVNNSLGYFFVFGGKNKI